jgi:protein O-GlcNAc transferase
VQILSGNATSPACDFNHDVPVVVFSSGGFTGNLFHEFNELIIPLFITCHHFRSHLQFVITDFKPWWVKKYSRILTHLSRFEVINLAKDRAVHCFPGAVIGLKYHDNLALNSTNTPEGYTMFDFKQFLRESYNLKIESVPNIKKPVLVLISRRKTRMFLNEDEMVGVMKELGFQVVVATANRMSNLDKFSAVINSCNVLVGAHGAGLTNAVFLPAGAVVVQVVPLGLDWASTNYYGRPVVEMGLHYVEYKIEPEESSLLDKYGPQDPVIADPMSIFLQGYNAARAVYVDGQNMKINLVRLRETLMKATKFLGH